MSKEIPLKTRLQAMSDTCDQWLLETNVRSPYGNLYSESRFVSPESTFALGAVRQSPEVDTKAFSEVWDAWDRIGVDYDDSERHYMHINSVSGQEIFELGVGGPMFGDLDPKETLIRMKNNIQKAIDNLS